MPATRIEPSTNPVELSVEDVMLNTWGEETGEYLRLDPSDAAPDEPPPSEES